jgi:hypothetical protein
MRSTTWRVALATGGGLLALLLLAACSMAIGSSDVVAGAQQGAKNVVPLSQSDTYGALAEYWAPQFYQDTASGDYRGDFLIKFNFDGDYVGNNNWEDLANYPIGSAALSGRVYFSVVESLNFYFLGYYTFHARDWDDINTVLNSHENDLEGVVLAVKKTGGNGTLVGAITLAHDQFYQYKAPGQDLTDGSDNVDATLLLNGNHPKIFIEAKGHGVFYYDGSGAPGGDGIVYDVNSANPQSPTDATGNYTHHYNYGLIAMDASSGDQGFWYRRNNIGPNDTFASWGILSGDTYGANKAKMPWVWDDADDGEVFSGDMLADPAHMFDCQLNGSALTGMSHQYTSNIYATHKFQIIALRSDANRDPFGGKSDIFLEVTAPGASQGTNDVLDARSFKKNDATVGTWYPFSYGAYDAEGQHTYSETVTTHYFARPGTPAVTFAVYDSDGTSGNDAMGSIVLSASADYSAGIDLGDSEIKFIFTKLQ